MFHLGFCLLCLVSTSERNPVGFGRIPKMDDGRDSGNVIQIIGGDGSGNGADNWDDQAVWATEDEYGALDKEASVDAASNLIYDGRQWQWQSQPRSGIRPTPMRTTNAAEEDIPANYQSTAIGNMFFKTKLCCKFRAGTCPFTNCRFAHSIEELRRPPMNWKEIVAAHGERGASVEPREELLIPALGSSSFMVEIQRPCKGRHCKRFCTEEGCPYGDNCTYIHDEQSKERVSVAIILGSGSGICYRDEGEIGNGGGSAARPPQPPRPASFPPPAAAAAFPPPAAAAFPPPPPAASNSTLKPSNWKTRICNKWEQSAYCPFGSNCRFAHGAAELHQYGGGHVDKGASPPYKQGLVGAYGSSAARADGTQRLPGIRREPTEKWKGPDKISRIYGDWIDDIE